MNACMRQPVASDQLAGARGRPLASLRFPLTPIGGKGVFRGRSYRGELKGGDGVRERKKFART